MQKYFEKIIGMLKAKKDLVPVNRLLDDIINDKPKELGQLMAYADAIEIVNQVAEEFATDTNAGHTKLLDSLHEKILKSTFAEEVTEAEIEALVKTKELTNNNQSLANDGWIPCSERLPEPGEIVIVCQTYSWEQFEDAAAVTIGRLRPGKRQYWEFQHYRPDFRTGTIMDNDIVCPGSEYVIAWQPLPEPYKLNGE